MNPAAIGWRWVFVPLWLPILALIIIAAAACRVVAWVGQNGIVIPIDLLLGNQREP